MRSGEKDARGVVMTGRSVRIDDFVGSRRAFESSRVFFFFATLFTFGVAAGGVSVVASRVSFSHTTPCLVVPVGASALPAASSSAALSALLRLSSSTLTPRSSRL